MSSNMTSKEFDLLISLVIAMLKDGKTEEVSRLLSGGSKENSVRLARELIDNYFG